MTRALDLHLPVGSHARRLNRLIDHIETHLADDLCLDKLAELAAFSPFHLHRLFRAWTGETLRDFVRRRRLETAGNRLRYDRELSIGELAHSCGFASAETFARAFRQHFGQTPSSWRQQGGPGASVLPTGLAMAPGAVTLCRLPARDLLYWRQQGSYAEVADPLWARFQPWVAALGLAGQPLLGMGLDDPAVTPAQHCRYDACVELPPAWQESAGLRPCRKHLAGGWHACLAFEGEASALGGAWTWLTTHWLPHSGFMAGSGSFFEAYEAGAGRGQGGWLQATLCMPVQPLAR